MAILHYLAYGSNLHPLRLTARVPSARAIGTVELPGKRIAFHKQSKDGSGKCLLYSVEQTQIAYGVLYEIDSKDKFALDKAEGIGNGYTEQFGNFLLNGTAYTPTFYVAQNSHINQTLVPYHWYKNLVVAGARYHAFPADYIASIEATLSAPDANIQRTQANEDLIRQMNLPITI